MAEEEEGRGKSPPRNVDTVEVEAVEEEVEETQRGMAAQS